MIHVLALESSAGITEGFSMCGGDFVEVYSDPSQFGMCYLICISLYVFRL